MDNFGGTKQSLRLFIIFDGSGVRGYMLSDENPVFQNEYSIPLEYHTWKDYNARALVAFEGCLRDFERKLGHGAVKPDDIVVVLGSPWYILYPRSVIYKKKTPFIVGEELISTMVENELDHLSKTQLDITRVFDTDSSLIFDHEIREINLNGYRFSNPVGKETHAVNVKMIVGVAPKSLIKNIKNRCESIFHQDPVFRMYHDVVARVASPIWKEKNIVFSIDRDLTDILEVTNSSVQKIYSVPIGYRDLVHRLSKSFSHPYREVENLLSLYSKERLEKKFSRRYENHIKQYLDEWTREVDKVLYTHDLLDGVSSIVCVSSHPSVYTFSNLLEKGELPMVSLGRMIPKISTIAFNEKPHAFWSLEKTITNV